jgi:hypothetical protein
LENTHPWLWAHERLSKWLLDYLPALTKVSHEQKCSNCLIHSSEWESPSLGIEQYTDSYGSRMTICSACYTLYESSEEAMGIERKAGKDGTVPNKFGMLASVAVLIEPTKTTMFLPDKIFQKLPSDFPITTVVSTKAEMRAALLARKIEYPAVYISDLGKKKKELVASIAFSISDERFVMCSADDVKYLNLTECRNAIAEFNKLPDKKTQMEAVKTLRLIIDGHLSPEEASQVIEESPFLARFLESAGKDPYQRKFILGEVR